MEIKPFAALRADPARVAEIVCPPYDVVDTAAARRAAAGRDACFFHVTRPEIDLPDSAGIGDGRVYEQGARALREFQETGRLVREQAPCLYVYRLSGGGGRCQTGIVACCSIDDYAGNVIRRHEKTRKDKEDDRTRLCLAQNANTGPVFLMYRGRPEIDALVEAACRAAGPLYDVVAPESGVRHTVWRLGGDAAAACADAFRPVPAAYVADGHHRAAAAFRAGMLRRSQNPAHTGREEYNRFMAVLFPASQLTILPYNRCVADLNGLSGEAFLKRAGEVFRLSAADGPRPGGPREIRMYLAGKWHSLAWDAFEADPVSGLDVSVLQDRLLAPVLGIEDPRTDKRISFAGGTGGGKELESRVDAGRAAVAFSLRPVTAGQIMDIADAGLVMPPKSTWFVPKLASGFLTHTLD